MANKYQIKEEHRYHAQLITIGPDKKAINLMGKDVEVKRPKRGKRPPFTETIPGATQEDLEAIYIAAKGKHKYIEKVEQVDKVSNNNSNKGSSKAS